MGEGGLFCPFSKKHPLTLNAQGGTFTEQCTTVSFQNSEVLQNFTNNVMLALRSSVTLLAVYLQLPQVIHGIAISKQTPFFIISKAVCATVILCTNSFQVTSTKELPGV